MYRAFARATLFKQLNKTLTEMKKLSKLLKKRPQAIINERPRTTTSGLLTNLGHGRISNRERKNGGIWPEIMSRGELEDGGNALFIPLQTFYPPGSRVILVVMET